MNEIKPAIPSRCIVCGSEDIKLEGPTYFCRFCQTGTLPHGDPILQEYWRAKIIAGVRYMRLLILLLCLSMPATAQTVVTPTVKPSLSEYQAKFYLQADWPTTITFSDSLLAMFSKTRWVGVSTARGMMKFQLLTFAPDTAGYTKVWVTTTLADTAKDTLTYRFRYGDVGRAIGFYPFRTGEPNIVSTAIRYIGKNDSITMSFVRLPLNLFAFDSAQAFSAGVSSVHADDSLSAVLTLLRWGIAAISYTDSVFWKNHEQELADLKILLGVNALKYFAASYTDAQVDSIQRSGARVYYMGAKTSGRTPIRGYGR